jgi:DNA-binding LytR/AlgR family response regulator
MRIVIVEDEIFLATRVERLCKEILGSKLHKVLIFTRFDDADNYINQHSIDLLLLDLNLQGQDGFHLLKKNVADAFHTIVISANAKRAIEAFEYGVLDFVAKPFTKTRLKKAIGRLEDRKKNDIKTPMQYLSVKIEGQIVVIHVADINYIKGAGNYSELYLKDGTTKLYDKALFRLLDIPPQNFQRLHRSYIVPMDLIVGINAVSGSDHKIELNDGSILPVSRDKIKEFRHL